MIVLTLFSRPDCHLCDEMVEALEPLVSGRARIEVVDISDDEQLTRKYGVLIPVLTHEGEELSRYRLDRQRVAALLDSQST